MPPVNPADIKARILLQTRFPSQSPVQAIALCVQDILQYREGLADIVGAIHDARIQAEDLPTGEENRFFESLAALQAPESLEPSALLHHTATVCGYGAGMRQLWEEMERDSNQETGRGFVNSVHIVDRIRDEKELLRAIDAVSSPPEEDLYGEAKSILFAVQERLGVIRQLAEYHSRHPDGQDNTGPFFGSPSSGGGRTSSA